MQTIISSDQTEATETIAEDIGKRLRGGEVIELVSDVGGGKTTFVRGLVRGAGSDDHVASPTFTISKLYKAPKFKIHHFDFYRLGEAGLIAHELADVFGDDSVVVVEWGGVVESVLPPKRLKIELISTDETSRDLVCTYPESLNYLFKDEK